MATNTIGSICRICGNRDNDSYYAVKEMQLGIGDEFEYVECDKCGCLQITEIPKNLSRYYENYASLTPIEDSNLGGITKFLSRKMDEAHIFYYSKRGGGNCQAYLLFLSGGYAANQAVERCI